MKNFTIVFWRQEARDERTGRLVESEEELPEPAAVNEGPDWGERGEQGKHFSVLADVQRKIQMGLRAEAQSQPLTNHKGVYRV